jgi:hypothetical protein
MTQADWAALAAAGRAGGTAYLEGAAHQANTLLEGVGGVPNAPLPSAQALSTQYNVGQDAISAVESQFPTLSWMLLIPELGPMIIQWAQQGVDAASAEAQFEGTAWYQQHSDSVRKWIAEANTDPAQALSDLQAQDSSVRATLLSLGLAPTQDQVNALARASLAQGWTDQQLKDTIAGSIKPGPNGTFTFTYGGQTTPVGQAGTLESSVQGVQNEAAKYLVPISNSTAESFARSLVQGTMDPSGVTAYFQHQASSLYPSIAGAIKAGITPADYVTPYQEVASQLLGVPAKSIDMTAPKYNKALSAPGPGGVPVAMSLYDFQNMMMRDPQYNYTHSVNAKDRASSLAQGIGELFGRTPAGPSGSTAFGQAGAPRIPGVPIS